MPVMIEFPIAADDVPKLNAVLSLWVSTPMTTSRS
jgi:hypothetical protein